MHRTWDLTAFFAVLVVVSLAVTRAHSQFPAKKLCADISCSVPIAEAEALIGFHGGGGDDRIAFRKGATMKIFGVTDGSRNKFFDVEVEGKRGWANSIHIKELRKLANASVEVPVRNDGEAVPSPSPPVDGVPPEIAGSSSTSVDPLEELLRTPTDPSLLDSFLNPSPTTTGPDFATASISKPEIAENGPPSVLAGSLEPTPSLQAAPEVLSTAMPSSEERSSTKIELLGDKFWGEGDDYEEDDDGEKNGEATPESPTDVTDRTSEVNAASGSAAESDDFLHETGNSSLGTEPEAAEMEVVGKEDGTQVVKEEVQIHGDISSEPAVASSLLIEEAREKRETEFGVGPAVEPEVVPQHEVFDEPPPPTQPAEDSPKESIQLSSGSGVESTLVEEPLQLSSGASVDSSVLDVLDSSVEKDTSNELFQQPSSGTSDSNGNVVVEMELGATPADVHNDEAAPSRPEVTTDHSERFTTDTDSPAEEEHRDHIASESAQGLGRTTVPQQVDHSSIVSENVETTAVPPQIVRGPVVTEHVETTAVPPQAHPSHIAAEDVEGTAKPQQMDHGPAVAETVKMTASPEQRDQGSSVTENTVTTAASQEMDQGSTVAENTVSTAASQEMDQGSTVAENNVRTAASQEKDQGSTVTENSVTTAASREMDQGSTVTENSATMAASREMDQGSIVTENSVTSAASQGMHPGHETAENIEETAAPQQLSDAPSKNPSQSGEEDGTAPPPTPSPHFYYSTRNTLEAKPEPVDEGSNLDEVEPVKGSLDTLEAEFVADHPLETEVDSEDPLLTASEESHAEVARDYTAEIPFDSGIPDDGPKVSGAFEEIVDAFRQLFDNFLDAVLPIIQYISTALQPLWPHIHAVIPPKYLNQATMLTVIAALYTVLTSFLYIVVRFVFRNKRVERDLIITANQVSNLVSLRDALKEENLNLTEELDKERQMHIQAGSRISTLEIDLDLTKKNLREVEKRLKAELEEKEGLQRELMETTETLETTQSLLNDSLLVKQGKFTEDDDALQMQFETLEKMLNDQTAKVTSLKADLNYTKEENAKLKERYLETERNMVDREEELAKLREGHEFLLKRTHERDENLEALKLALGLEDEGPESGENRIVSSFRAILNGDGDASSELSNLFDVGRAKRQIRELEKENEELQVKVTELEVLREHVLTKDGELERLREKEKELQFVETFYRKKEEELLSEISRLKQREDRFLSQEKEGRTLADYIQTLEDKLRLIESDKQNSDVRGKEKVIELEKELCDCKFRLQQTQRRLEGVITENNELRKRVGLRHSNAKASPSGSIGDGVDGLMPFAPDLVPPMLPPGMLPPLMRGPGGPMPPPMMGPRPPLPPGMPGGPPPPLADRLPPLGDQGRPEPPPGPPGMPPFQLPPRPPFFPGPPGMVPPPPHLMGRPGSPGRGSEGGNGGRRSRNRSPSPGWSDRSAPARGFYRSSLRRRSRSISPNSRGSLRSPPYRPNMGPMDFPDDRSIGSNGGRDREGGRGSVPPSQPRRLDPRGGRGGRYSESPSPPPPPYYDDPPSRGSRGRRDGHEDERRRNGRSPNAYV